ncbi:MAG TPA: RagB/SusD family nutrient uptake outer membrane protein, partial [Arachidicoccus sp.]|nr:RagB/SusD family nutrient uptake outer membrane protein [Arachidicoccus sp.]
MNKLFLIVVFVMIFANSCEKIFSPEPENLKTIDQMYTDQDYAQGFLVNAYRSIPGYYDDADYATDDAVTNQKSNAYLKMATGAWTASDNPANLWQTAFGAIQYLNLFLQNSTKVDWAADSAASQLFSIRMRGEAFGLRAVFMYYLLRNHAGIGEDGTLLGVPNITEFLTVNSEFNMPRATFAACVKQVYEDLDSAELDLPFEYEDIGSSSQIPARFSSITQSVETYNRVMGHYSRQLFNGLIAKSFRSKMALLAASPAFQGPSNPSTWVDAADD